MRTSIAIEMQALNADSTPARGQLCITPNAPDASTTIYTFTPVCGELDLYGRLVAQGGAALQVFASDDTGFDTVYTVTSQLVGQDLLEFQCYVPKESTATELAAQTTEGLPVVTLTSLIAANPMLGQTIVGDNWPEDTTVVAVSIINNTVTLSQNATATGECEATVGGAVMFETLVANRLSA